MFIALVAAVLVPTALVSTLSCSNPATKQQDTLVINTSDIGYDYPGRNGPTPVEITVVKGVISSIKALPSREGGRYLKMIEDAGLMDKLNGLTLEEAKQVQLDAVSGATMSSDGLIGNIKVGLEDGGAHARKVQKIITEAKVKQGKVKGFLDRGIGTFYAIPFAEAPVGELRWKAPVPKQKWDGVFDATVKSGMPPQPVRADSNNQDPLITEDCLNLNIQTPAISKKDKLPVLVWIHGGAFLGGDSNTDGIAYARQGIVFVSLNYRTGALGFLALPELSAENPQGISGNYGLLDMIEGLKWVKENIAQFGGDPSKVTIMGESAGAIATSMLCASPLAKGLFRGAISESGGSFCPVDSVRTNNNGLRDMARAEQYGVDFMHRMGASSLAELRAMDWHKWMEDPSLSISGFWPTMDGYVIPDDQYKLYEAGQYNDVNILIGTNSDEGAGFLQPKTLAQFQEDVRAEYGPFAEKVLELYPATDDLEAYNALSDTFRETAFAWHTWVWAKLQQKTGKGKVWLYYFDQFNPRNLPSLGPNGPSARAAVHASELPYVFGPDGRPYRDGDKAVSRAMQTYWGNFVKTGNPNGAAAGGVAPGGADKLPEWPVYQDGAQTVMLFKNGTSLIDTPKKPQLEVMDAYFAWRRERAGR